MQRKDTELLNIPTHGRDETILADEFHVIQHFVNIYDTIFGFIPVEGTKVRFCFLLL